MDYFKPSKEKTDLTNDVRVWGLKMDYCSPNKCSGASCWFTYKEMSLHHVSYFGGIGECNWSYAEQENLPESIRNLVHNYLWENWRKYTAAITFDI